MNADVLDCLSKTISGAMRDRYGRDPYGLEMCAVKQIGLLMARVAELERENSGLQQDIDAYQSTLDDQRRIRAADNKHLEVENSRLRERIIALRRAIDNHNRGSEDVCNWRAKRGDCEAYTSRDLQCPDCPRHDMIEVPA